MVGDSKTTLGKRAGSDAAPGLISAYVRERARIAAEVPIGGNPGRRLEALASFAEYVGSQLQDDQRIRALYVLMGYSGSTEEYRPGEIQRQVVALLGADRAAPQPSSTLSELVAAAVDDVVVLAGEKEAQVRRERDEAQAQAEGSREAEERSQRLSTELEECRAERQEFAGALAEREGQIAQLQAMLGGTSNRQDGAAETRRRTRVPDAPGVYFTDTANGRVYEVGFREDGKQRWKRIGPDLDEAVATRKEILERQRAAA